MPTFGRDVPRLPSPTDQPAKALQVSFELPRLVVAGTRSDVGKTTVVTGLLAALTRAGHRVSGHKVGPDFVDPSYHALATGRPPRNLDTVLHGIERVGPLLAHGAAHADLAIIEGVMGLFDGRAAGDAGSTAEMARLLDAPVLLVVDASAASRSVAAEVHGFATFDPSVQIAGVVLNRLGSTTHEALVREAVAVTGVPVVGAIPREPTISSSSGRRGLTPARRRSDARRGIDAAADLVTRHVDLAAVVRLAQTAPPLHARAWDPATEVAAVGDPRGAPLRVAVAGGEAFLLPDTEHLELLEAAGAEVVVFDPLGDERLPERTDALLLGGELSEGHTTELSANRALIADVRHLAHSGAPIVGECGGLLYLCRDLDGVPMTGVLAASATTADRLTIGYRDVVLAADGILGTAGTSARAHEFRRTRVRPRCGDVPGWRFPTDDRLGPEGFSTANVHASFLHASWVGTPSLPAALVHAARAGRP